MTNLEKAAMRPVYILSKWIGYKEKSSPYNLYYKTASNDATSNKAQDYTLFNQYFNDLYKYKNIDFYMTKGKNQGVQWCDVTYHWAQCMAWGPNMALRVLHTTKYNGGYYQSRACRYSKVYYVNAGAWIKGNESNGVPKVGDQIFFFTSVDPVNPNHTGIVSNVTATSIEVIEGNAGTNARYLTKKTYKRKAANIDGYGRPNYSLVQNQFENINYDAPINLADALMLTDAKAIAAVNKVMGTASNVIISSQTTDGDTSVSVEAEIEKQKYTMTEEEITQIKDKINIVIDTLKQAILNYNSGIIDKSKLQMAQRNYENLKQKYNEYATRVQDKLTNFESIWKYINLLYTTEFPAVSELDRKRSLGNTDWFARFIDQYNSLIRNFTNKVNNIYSILLSQIQNGSKYTDSYKQYVFSPTIPKPEDTGVLSIIFLWSVFFENNNQDQNIEKYINDYIGNNKKIDYDAASYDAYEDFMEYYNNVIIASQEKINKYSIEQNISIIIQELLNILQAEVYKLYAMTYGNIVQKKIGDSITYEKYGIAYNFGDDNYDYKAFYTKYKSSIFGDKMYLQDISFAQIAQYINKVICNLEELQQERIATTIALYENQVGYESNISNFMSQAKELSGLVVDWRELIYQMAKDYYDYANNPKYDYTYTLTQNNPTTLQKDNSTGYEVFYTDVLGFWRQLYYNPLLEDIDFSIEENTNYAYTYLDYSYETFWNKIVYSAPSTLNFWFDLTEGSGEITNYQISLVGDRLKATKDTKITALYQAEVPNIIYYDQDNISYIQENASNASYSYFQLGGPMSDVYTVSSQGRSAIDVLQEQLYKFIYCVENVTITTLPIYTLQPNYRIIVNSRIPGLSGEYIVTKYTIPFTYNATTSITATKAVPYIGING